MDIIDLQGKRDLPITTNLLLFMQNAYSALEKLAGMYGTDYIVSGIDNQGGSSYSDGVIVLGGELMPFVGGTDSNDKIKVVTVTTDVAVGGYSRKEITKYATFGTPVGGTTYYLSKLKKKRVVPNRVYDVVIPIGAWNMATDDNKAVYISDYIDVNNVEIVGMSVWVYSDSNLAILDLQQGTQTIDAGGAHIAQYPVDPYVYLTKMVTNSYTGWSSTSVNRGYITLRIKDK